MTGIELRDVSVVLGPPPTARQVLHGIDLVIASGERVAFVGSNGSGKTTLLRVVGRLVPPLPGGTVDFGAPDRAVAWMPQDYRKALFPWWTALANVLLRFPETRLDPPARALVRRLFERARVRPDALPGTLSGGQQQVVVLLRAILHPEAGVVVLDEPLSAVDLGLRLDCRAAVCEEVARRNLTLLVATHDLLEAVRLAQRVVVLADGRVRQDFRVPETSDDAAMMHLVRDIEALIA